MPFQFSLAAVLRYRENIEDLEYLTLEKRQQEVILLEREIQQVEKAWSEAEKKRSFELAAGLCAADLQSAYDYQIALEQQRDALRAQLQEARRKWREQMQVYQGARRRREMLEKLRSQQGEQYGREQAKREQNAMDEIFLSRRRRE